MILNLKINLNSDKTALTTRDELTTKEELDWRLAPEKTIWSEDEAEMTHNIVEAFEKMRYSVSRTWYRQGQNNTHFLV